MPSVAQIIRRRRNRKQRRSREKTRSRLWSGLIFGSLSLLILGPLLLVIGFISFLYIRAVNHMPSPADTIYLDPIIADTNFYDDSGVTLIYSVQDPLGDERQWVTLESLPEYLIDATIQMEDPDFIEVGSFDIWQLGNRLWAYGLGTNTSRDTTLAGRLASQTLVPNAGNSGLDPELLHIVFTSEVQRRFTARRVLEWYLNTAFYGNDAYGIDAAAQVYFGKMAMDLSLDEAAMLAAIPLAPQFNPLDNEQAARDRQLDLLRNMRAFEHITTAEFDAVASIATPIRTDLAQPPFIAPDFSIFAREQSEAILDSLGLDGARLVSRGGLRITTTLDLELYYQTECILRAHLTQLREQNPDDTLTLAAQPCVGTEYLSDVIGVNPTSLPNEGAIVIHDVQTGEIRAMVGDANSYSRQPGPTVYPFVYLTGFFSGNFTAARMLLDIPRQFPGTTEGSIYAPINADGRYNGPLNLRDAMAASLRVPAIEVANREGLTNILQTSRTLGLNSLSDTNLFDLSLIDRGGNVSVLDITYAYSVFASMGELQGVGLTPIGRDYRSRNPVAVLQIADAEGNVLWQYDSDMIAVSWDFIAEAEFMYIVNDILSDSTARNQLLDANTEVFDIERPVAISNGLTGDTTDSWTIGYTPQLVVGVYVGRDDAEQMSLDNYGLQGAAPIWQAVSRLAHDRYQYQPAIWPRPDGIWEIPVCDISGLLIPVGSQCERHTEIFHEQVLPQQEDIYWQTVEVNSLNGLRASATTQESLVEEQVYFVPPPDAMEWWETNGQPLPPTEVDTLNTLDAFSAAQIFLPQELAYVSGEVDIRGSVNTNNMQSYQVRYAQGFRPNQWFTIGDTQTTFIEGVSLGTWDTRELDGPYTVEISVLRTDGTVGRSSVRVTVDNTEPTITLITGEDGETLFRWPTETVIPLEAFVEDNLAIDRIEFYNNGELMGTVTEEPYQWIFPIERVGDEIFTATVFDQAGNQATTEVAVEIIRQ